MEAESKRAGETIEERFARRQRESAPLIAKLKAWVEARSGDVEPKSTLGQAVGYIRRQWPRLTRFDSASTWKISPYSRTPSSAR